LQRVMLERLPPTEIRELVEGTVAGLAAIPEAVTNDIERRSEGNPFFAEELVRSYLEYRRSGHEASQLPISIKATIVQRLVVLSPDERAILANAAILGQRFDPAVLAAVMERPLDSIAPALRRAHDLNLLADADAGRHTSRFRHALTRQAIYESVSTFERRQAHLKILSTLEALPDHERFIEELAEHASEAGDAAKTLHYNERAGDTAFGLRALPEALMFFRRALGAATTPDDRARLLDRIGAVERVQGHSEAARDVLEEALGIRLELGDVDKAALLTASVIGQRYNLGDRSALSIAERFLSEHRAGLSPVARDHLLVVCARVACAFGEIPDATRFLDTVSDPTTLATGIRQNYLIVTLMLHAFVGDLDAWRRAAADVERLLPRLRPEAVVSTEAALAMTGIFIGANEEVERALDRADRVEREWGFRGQRLYALATRSSYLFQRGRLAAALACVEEVAANQDFHPARRVGALVAAHLAVALDDDAIWLRFDPEVLREARNQPDDPDCAYIIGAHASLAVRNGARAEAEADLRTAIRSLKYAAPEAMHLIVNAARYLPLEELSTVRELVDKAAGHGDVTNAIRALGVATIDAREGRETESVASASTAVKLFASVGWPLLEAYALELAGDRARALQLYTGCGAAGELRRLSGVADAKSLASSVLSSRETQVAELVANGLRNAEIARRLSIGKKTVEKHLASVFDKLGLRSRAQIGARLAAMKDPAPR
jgi:DNA-binding CsgD family transcriptional regulator/tetratricopeptide (TPR) repeat protein